MNAVEVGDVIAVVAKRGGIHRQEPNAVDPELFDVVELLSHPAKIALAVSIGVVERSDWSFIEDGVFEPEGIVTREAHPYTPRRLFKPDGLVNSLKYARSRFRRPSST